MPSRRVQTRLEARRMMSTFRSSRLDAITLLAADHPSAPVFSHRAIFVQSRSGSATLVVPPGNGRSMVACVRSRIFGRKHPCHMGRKVAACKQASGELRPPNRHLPSMKGHVKNFSVTAGALVGARFGSLPGGLRRRNSHDLSALRATQCPRVGMACLVG
jgi:hypothetical protein